MPRTAKLDVSAPYLESSESENVRPIKKSKKRKELKFKERVLNDLDDMGTTTKKIKHNVSITQAMAADNLQELEKQGAKIATTADKMSNIEYQADKDEAVVHGSTSCLGGCMHALIPSCFKSGKSHHKEQYDQNLSKRKAKKVYESDVLASHEDDLFQNERPIVYRYADKKAAQSRFDEINGDLDEVDQGVERLRSIANDTSSELMFQRGMVDSIAKKSEKTEKHQKKSKKHIKKLALNS